MSRSRNLENIKTIKIRSNLLPIDNIKTGVKFQNLYSVTKIKSTVVSAIRKSLTSLIALEYLDKKVGLQKDKDIVKFTDRLFNMCHGQSSNLIMDIASLGKEMSDFLTLTVGTTLGSPSVTQLTWRPARRLAMLRSQRVKSCSLDTLTSRIAFTNSNYPSPCVSISAVKAGASSISELDGNRVSPGDVVTPRLKAIPMGWSQALSVVQTNHQKKTGRGR